MRHAAAALLTVLLAVFVSSAASTQEQAPPTSLVVGYVVDSSTRQPVAGAVVELPEFERRLITDSQGRFAVLDLPWGSHIVRVRMLGYTDYEGALQVLQEQANFTIALGPQPIVLEGVTAHGYRFVELLERRRQRVGWSARVISRNRLSMTTVSAQDAVLQFGGLPRALCPDGRASGFDVCVMARGRPVRPQVFIDDQPAIGGLRDLDAYSTNELYLIEILQGGRQIRAYTTWWIEAEGRRNRRPGPFMPGPTGS